ncbi:cupin domain-containing protein [Luteipulveratus mongoliensis]|uniref:Cupin n=1 Tax=Luteipulveratus mongoliensis TaxID=571913 RepID=A0A0K1JGI0_9MICO|nr:cupin domain-containing protein [Luteipulveratus mongoliensis]AKU15822.1 cupin [Luteipulveratus mongoliensis]
MNLIQQSDVQAFSMHGSEFRSYVAPRSGSTQLCAWELAIAPETTGQEHTVSHEEVLLLLDGNVEATVDGVTYKAAPSDVVRFPAGATVRLDNPHDQSARLWVTTSVGLHASLPDGTQVTPPWTQ